MTGNRGCRVASGGDVTAAGGAMGIFDRIFDGREQALTDPPEFRQLVEKALNTFAPSPPRTTVRGG